MKPAKRNRKLVEDYRDNHFECEVSKHLQGEEWTHHKQLNRTAPDKRDLQIHHIWGGTKSKFDVVPNIILVNAITHRFLQAHHYTNILVCTFVKVSKEEFDRELMRYVAGKDVIGVIDNMDCNLEWLEEMRMYILERF